MGISGDLLARRPRTAGEAVDALLERAFDRWGTTYVTAFAAAELLGALTILAAALVFVSLYEPISAAQAWHVGGVGLALTLVAFAWRTMRIRGELLALRRWIRQPGEVAAAHAAWEAAHALPGLVMRADVEGLIVAALPTAVFAAFELHLPGLAVPLMMLLVAVVIGQTLVIHVFSVELALRPLLRKVRPRLPAVYLPPRRGISLRRRLLGTLPLANIVTGLAVAGLAQPGPGGLEALRADVLLVLVVAAAVSLLVGFLLAAAIVAPLDELAGAAERVHQGDLTVQVVPTASGELGRLAANFEEMVSGLAGRQALHHALERYVDPSVAARIIEEGLELMPREVDATVMFVDLRGFTAFAEGATASCIVARVNQLLEVTLPAIVRHGGHVNKFMGDGVLAVFGTPVPLEDHADRAMRAALEVLDAAAAAQPALRLGIGISSGRVTAGTVGAAGRCEFAVMGDTVNVAARAQEATKHMGVDVLFTDSTLERMTAIPQSALPIGRLELRGRRGPVVVHGLGAPAAAAA
jgi:class 3 adenylate cyclase